MKKLFFLVPVLFFFASLNLFANKTTVSVKSSATLVPKGTEVTITISVTHKGNSKMHYTDWVTVKFNGKEVKRWEYTKTSLPSDDNFTLQYKMKVVENGVVEVQGHCNLHGSTGAKTIELKIE
ncbi:MAG TPA: desulfoferrodoxin family protein [Bacteroidales bacterium]|nr:desulfoferrodoxin family protein [Bacteroidales bacterium]HPJ58378.1 desulfoferrodoxin family protein [Bacteroidales bacterium]HPR10816.1 desulfoferrodoxin family protein [Bacteroidales bacterium]HRW85999.1 desulfoferrodoxin family protein [Bacteroidales bacterium]